MLTPIVVFAQGVVAGGILGGAASLFVVLGSTTVAGYQHMLPPTNTDTCDPPINATETTSPVSL